MIEFLNNFHLLRPAWLLAGLPASVLLWLVWRRTHSGQGWRQIIDPELLPHLLEPNATARSTSPVQGLMLIWLLAILALAGPSWEKIPQPVQRKQDALVILLDLSYSMLSEDVSPSRLQRSRHKLRDLLQMRREGSTALVAYAGDAHVVSPLTDDNRTIANLLAALDPAIMPVKGNKPALAVEQALALFSSAGVVRGQILLVSDGVRESDISRINELLRAKSYTLSVLGVGTSTGGPIPMPQQGLLKDADNNIVIASLDRGPLRRLASANGGAYSDLTLDEEDLDSVIRPPFDPSQDMEMLLDRSADQWHDAGFWLVLALMPLALGAFRRGWLLCIPLLFLLPPQPAVAFEWQDLWRTRDQHAAQLLAQGDPATAAQVFEDPEWEAAANYRAEDFEAAQEQYSRSDTAQAWYNRGNALAKSGKLPDAIKAYEEALARDPGLEDASFNKDLVEQLQQQREQQNQQQQNQDQQDQDQQDQEQQDQDQQGQDQQDQQQQDQDQQDQDQQDQQQQNQDQQDQQQQDQQDQDQQDQQQQNQDQQDQQDQEQQSRDREQQEQQLTEAEKSDEEQEREQATEQWLRRVPDDPSGLLRRKFHYESQQNKRQRRESDETDW